MGNTLTQIAEKLKDSSKKVQLIYAFNGVGKTRLSREFRLLVGPEETSNNSSVKVIYYNAFTEDLFYWDNDLSDDKRKIKIQPNSLTKWILVEQGEGKSIIDNFQHYSNTKVLPRFNEDSTTVSFSLPQDNGAIDNIKISKGEESNFVWSIFYSLLEQVVEELKELDLANRSTNIFADLKYVFIDDPVSSLDDNHLIELAVNLAELIKNSHRLKFIISTHNPLFYNVLFNALKNPSCFMLNRMEDGTFELNEKNGDSNQSFSYHLHLKSTIEQAINQNKIQKYHFMLLRNLYEKTASFLGYRKWSELLPDDEKNSRKAYLNRIINFTSHSKLSNEAVAEPTAEEKKMVEFLLNHLIENYSYWQEAIDA